MPPRSPMPDNSVFHIFNRSIANFEIFRGERDFGRFTWMMRFFAIPQKTLSFSKLTRDYKHSDWPEKINALSEKYPSEIQIIAYCLMPTHIHMAIKQQNSSAISKFMKNLLSSYAQYFNLTNYRKGPLWEGRFKHVLCETDEQLLHLTRYIHLNPVTACLTDKPENWMASSYGEYLSGSSNGVCNWRPLLTINPGIYQKFTNSRIDDQRTLAKIKKLLMD